MYSPVWTLWLHVEFWLGLGIQTLTSSPSLSLCCPQAAASHPGIKRNSSPPPPPEPMVWLTPGSPLSTACQGLISLPYSRVISWLTVSHSFITSTHSLDHQLQVYWFRSDDWATRRVSRSFLGSVHTPAQAAHLDCSESMYSVFMTSKCCSSISNTLYFCHVTYFEWNWEENIDFIHWDLTGL